MNETARLDGWKEIAAYLNRSVRSAHRWNQELGLPVHRLPGSRGNIVYALKSEIDRWVDTRERDDVLLPGDPSSFSKRWIVPVAGACILLLALVSYIWLQPALEGRGDGSVDRVSAGGDAASGEILTVSVDDLVRPLGRVVFCVGHDGNPEIHVMNDDGSAQVRLTDHPAWDLYPVFSPDGSQIAFSSDRNGDQAEIFIMDADGANVRQLTSGISSDHRYTEGLHWHPSGEKLVFSFCLDNVWQLFEIDADGSNLRQLTRTPHSNLRPRYSRDGNSIHVMRIVPNDGHTSDIFVLSGEDTRQLTFTRDNRAPDEVLVDGVPTLYFTKAFSKETQQVFYLLQTPPARGVERISRQVRPAEYPLLRTNSGFAEPHVVGARGPGAALAMNQILVVSDRGGEGTFNIWRMGTDGQNSVRLTAEGAGSPDWWIPLPAAGVAIEVGEATDAGEAGASFS